MNEDIEIRPARASDAEALARFQERMALATEEKRLDPETVRAGVRAALADDTLGFYLIAAAGDAIVGGLMVTFEWSDWRHGRFYWIQSVFVRDEYRGRGVYRRLHEAVRDHARAAGDVVGIRLYVEQDNEIARATYSRLGMAETPYRLYEEEL